MRLALLDLDIVGYRSAASCEPTKVKPEREPLESALARTEELMRRILHETGAKSYLGFISGPENYRYAIDPTYKANRADKPRPEWLQPCREYLVMNWNAKVCNGIEADDALGIHQTSSTVICSIDKDLLMIEGRHYNFVTGEWKFIDKLQGLRNFYTQLLLGDNSDNIRGYDGLMRQKVPQFLQPIVNRIISAETELEMFEIIHEVYQLGDEALLSNGRLLYIQRTEGDEWNFPS